MEVLLQGAQISFIFFLLLLQDTLIPISKGESQSLPFLLFLPGSFTQGTVTLLNPFYVDGRREA